jgi:two-component system chemotaxis response regulator CheB
MSYDAVVIGASAGGMNAMKAIFSALPASCSLSFIVVQHIGARSDGWWIEFLNEKSELQVKEANEKEEIEKGTVYIAPPNYHLLVEKNRTFSLTIGERVNFARPSIDLLFESAAEAYRDRLIGIVLTGSNHDGASGLKKIKELGGLTIVENPEMAEWRGMPDAAIAAVTPDHILSLNRIPDLLMELNKKTGLSVDTAGKKIKKGE